MIELNAIIAIIAVVILFLFSIEHFSKDVQLAANKKIKKTIRKATSTPIKSTIIGALTTSIIQSSSATTVITVGLVNAGILTFANSLGVIFGANIGTTVTSQLVALKLTVIAPIFIILGFLIKIFGKNHFKLWGEAIFYFGLIFFSLSLISDYVEPLKNNQNVLSFFYSTSNIFLAILIGIVFTIIVQSSSVTSGIVVVLAGSGFIGLVQAFAIILGANIGTTSTAFLASIRMSKEAKRTALAHCLFNIMGVIIILPFIFLFVNFVSSLGGSLGQQVANAHLIFNLSITIIFLIFIKPFRILVEKVVD